MRINLKILTWLLLLSSFSCVTESTRIKTIQNFIESVSNDDYPALVIDKYIAVHDSTNHEIVTLSLRELQEGFHYINTSELKYSIYNAATHGKIILPDGESKNVFVVETKHEPLIYVWMKGGLIQSFSTLNKGGTRVFITY